MLCNVSLPDLTNGMILALLLPLTNRNRRHYRDPNVAYNSVAAFPVKTILVNSQIITSQLTTSV